MTCAKCGASLVDYFDPEKAITECPVVVFCLQRQLSNQSALLRSVTGKLEEASQILVDAETLEGADRAIDLIASVLEILA